MKPTLDQLNELSDYEINCAVAEKLGYVVIKRGLGADVLIKTMRFSRPVNYCNTPNDYMPIASENCITIDFNTDDTVCGAYTREGADMSDYNPYDFICSDDMPKSQTGRAVCIAFLLMEIDK